MRIDFSEPECSTCFHYRTSGILNPHHQEPEPSNVISSSVNSIPVQAFGHDDSAAIGSIPASSSPPIHGSSSPIRTGTPITNQNQNRNTTSVIAMSSAPPTEALNQTNFSFSGFSIPKPPQTGSIQAPVQASTFSSFGTVEDFGKTTPSASASEFGNGFTFARTDIGYVDNRFVPTTTSTVVFGTTPVSVSSVCNPTTPKNPFGYYPWDAKFSSNPNLGSSSQLFSPPYQEFGKTASSPSLFENTFDFPRTDVGYAPNHSRPNLWTTGVGFGNTPTSVSSISNPTTQRFAPHYDGTFASYNIQGDQGSRSLFDPPQGNMNGNVPTLDVDDASNHLASISASNAYLHEALRLQDYKQGDKGGLFAPAYISPFRLRPNTIFSSRSIPDHSSLRPNFGNTTGSVFSSFPAGVATSFGQTNAPFTGFATTLFSSSSSSSTTTVQRPHETVVVSSPATSGCCTACGATTSSTTTTTPPPPPSSAAATFLSGLLSTSSSLPMMTTLAAQDTKSLGVQASPALLGTDLADQGTSLGVQTSPTLLSTNLAAQGTSPTVQASPTLLGTNRAAQGTPTPGLEASSTLHGTNLAAKAKGRTPTFHAYPTMLKDQNIRDFFILILIRDFFIFILILSLLVYIRILKQ